MSVGFIAYTYNQQEISCGDGPVFLQDTVNDNYGILMYVWCRHYDTVCVVINWDISYVLYLNYCPATESIPDNKEVK